MSDQNRCQVSTCHSLGRTKSDARCHCHNQWNICLFIIMKLLFLNVFKYNDRILFYRDYWHSIQILSSQYLISNPCTFNVPRCTGEKYLILLGKSLNWILKLSNYSNYCWESVRLRSSEMIPIPTYINFWPFSKTDAWLPSALRSLPMFKYFYIIILLQL